MNKSISIISKVGATICTAIVVVRYIGRWQYQHIFGVTAENFTQISGCANFYVLLFWVVYEPSRWIQQRKSIKSCANLGKSTTETPAIFRNAFGEESMSRTHRDRKGRDRWRAKLRACSSFSSTSRGLIVHKGFALAGQTVNSAYHCDVLWQLRENVRTLRLRSLAAKELTLVSRQRTASHFLSHQGIFYQNNMTVVPTHPTFLCFHEWG
jgi:hypothetical protein